MLKSKLRPILLSVSVLWITSLACVVSGASTPSSDSAIGTIAAATIYAELTQTARSIIPVTSLASATSTFTPAFPTNTPTQTLSPTPIFTPTPLVPQISVSVATNCRVGPGKAYERVGALLVGEVAQVLVETWQGTIGTSVTLIEHRLLLGMGRICHPEWLYPGFADLYASSLANTDP